MRNGIVGAVVAAIVVGVIAFVMWRQPLMDAETRAAGSADEVEELQAAVTTAMSRKPRKAVITLKQDETKGAPLGLCTAEIDEQHMGGYRDEEVKWCVVDDEEKACRPSGAWAVFLVFKDDQDNSPFSDRRVRIGRGCRVVRIKQLARERVPHAYKVWMRTHSNSEYELIDPDIEVEPPIRFAPPPPPPPATPPATPPAKKQ